MTDIPNSVLVAGYMPLDIVSFEGKMWHAAGGTAGNVAAILSFLGWTSGVVADVGGDAGGATLLADLRKANVSVKHVRVDEKLQTPRIVHQIDERGHRYSFRCPRCLSKLPASRPLRLERAEAEIETGAIPSVFFFDRANAATVLLAEHFAGRGSVVVFEPSRPARSELISRAMKVASIVKQASDRDTGLDLDSIGKDQVAVVTEGAAGTRYRIGRGRWAHSPAFPYPVVDAGGAGDWTTAGLVHALALGAFDLKQTADSIRWAQALAAVSCGAAGARGLAQTQSRSSVVEAVAFLRNKGEIEPTKRRIVRNVVKKASGGRCSFCLLPDSDQVEQVSNGAA